MKLIGLLKGAVISGLSVGIKFARSSGKGRDVNHDEELRLVVR